MQVITYKPYTPSNPLSATLMVSLQPACQIKLSHNNQELRFGLSSQSRDEVLSHGSKFSQPLRLRRNSRFCSCGETRAIGRSTEESLSAWDDEPYELLPSGKKAYIDEQDILTFLDPPKELIPLDPASYNPAAYIWKKIGDIPEERRHQLLYLLKPRLISRLWEISGTRYEDSNLVKKSASSLLSTGDRTVSSEFWNCRTSGGPIPMTWMNFFNKAIFCSKDGMAYGRIIIGGLLAGVTNSFSPLYFTVRQLKEVMSTEEPCDFAYEFGDGLLNLHDCPEGFPKPVKHPWPFNDHVVIYVRHVGPGVLVGQAWQEGKVLEQVPKKLCGEILMAKDYAAYGENQ
ncbi:uncharacterized protein LOC122657351 [Telopea speciosissima]|uniref:uncharacterized protein LOC122657351 n=1 Tax=Telopea speciosissima TaxID=54955 RepID=UPI001CC6F668|nr:uncharacterized protein LOC122657351 [Telopea speciosissima]